MLPGRLFDLLGNPGNGTTTGPAGIPGSRAGTAATLWSWLRREVISPVSSVKHGQ
jgi:hypothetical protein